MDLQNDVRIDQYGTAMSCHDASQVDCVLDVMQYEEMNKILDTQIEQPEDQSHRDAAFVDRKSEHFHEGSLEQGGRGVLNNFPSVVEQHRIRQGACRGGLQLAERPPHQRGFEAHLRRQCVERGYPTSGAALTGFEPLGVDAGLALGEAPFAREQERISEVFQRSA